MHCLPACLLYLPSGGSHATRPVFMSPCLCAHVHLTAMSASAFLLPARRRAAYLKTCSGCRRGWQGFSSLSEAGGGPGDAAIFAQREGGEGVLAPWLEGLEAVGPVHGGLGRRHAPVHCGCCCSCCCCSASSASCGARRCDSVPSVTAVAAFPQAGTTLW